MNLQSPKLNSNYPSSEDLKEELLSVLLDLDQEEAYPWNPFEPEMENYFEEIENRFAFADGLDEDLDEQADTFFSHLHQQWAKVETSTHQSIRENIAQKFHNFLPKSVLDGIIEQAEQIAAQNLNQINQVVECVKPLWKSWTIEDLQVFARPVVYAMRDKTPTTKAPWEELTEFEQIRLTMAVAQEAIQALSTPCEQ